MNKAKFKLLLSAAFEAGRWLGQVDLEESMDREQYATCILESINAKRTSMPILPSSVGKTVQYNLRSSEWREGVKKTTKEMLEALQKNNTFKAM